MKKLFLIPFLFSVCIYAANSTPEQRHLVLQQKLQALDKQISPEIQRQIEEESQKISQKYRDKIMKDLESLVKFIDSADYEKTVAGCKSNSDCTNTIKLFLAKVESLELLLHKKLMNCQALEAIELAEILQKKFPEAYKIIQEKEYINAEIANLIKMKH